MARWLERAGLLVIGLARNGVANYDFTFGNQPRPTTIANELSVAHPASGP
jgi:hypothetical protein